MAFGGSQKGSLTNNLRSAISCSKTETKMSEDTAWKCENSSYAFATKQDETVKFLKKGNDDSVCCKFGDKKINDFADNITEKNVDEINQSSDSLSSSASISDSDLTSTDSDDSLALSESESITDVTPLNSPYCDSPLPQSRHIDHKSEDKVLTSCRNVDYEGSGDNCHRPEMNVLMKAIEKIELEAKTSSEFSARENIVRRRASSFTNEEAKRIEQENQRLFKRVISQQNRIRSMYASSTQPSSRNISCRSQDSGRNDGDISISKKSITGKFPKQGDKTQVHRKQKCISHPSSFIYSCNHALDKSLFADGLSSGGSGKKKYIHASSMKIACSPKCGNRCDEDISSVSELK